MNEPTSRLGKLVHSLDSSGINGNPIITDTELKELHDGLTSVARFMRDRQDMTMWATLAREAESVARIISARGRNQ